MLRNVAAVVVTTNIPPFSRNGTRLDVTVSAIGNAMSLRGGVLVQTPLRGADRKTYAVAQGPLIVGGFSASGANGSSITQNSTNTGRVPEGALVEREIPTEFVTKGEVTLSLRQPDFSTADHIAQAIDKSLGNGSAKALDGGAVVVKVPSKLKDKPVQLVSELSDIDVEPSHAARVVINERTGTIVAGGDVKLWPAAISQGGITIAVKEHKAWFNPTCLPGAKHTGGPIDGRDHREDTTVHDVCGGGCDTSRRGTGAFHLRCSPREMASIMQALRGAGALRAEIIVQ